MEKLSPEILEKVAEFGDSYITFLYFEELLPIFALVLIVFIVFRWG